jgi:hypothetical protein
MIDKYVSMGTVKAKELIFNSSIGITLCFVGSLIANYFSYFLSYEFLCLMCLFYLGGCTHSIIIYCKSEEGDFVLNSIMNAGCVPSVKGDDHG